MDAYEIWSMILNSIVLFVSIRMIRWMFTHFKIVIKRNGKDDIVIGRKEQKDEN